MAPIPTPFPQMHGISVPPVSPLRPPLGEPRSGLGNTLPRYPINGYHPGLEPRNENMIHNSLPMHGIEIPATDPAAALREFLARRGLAHSNPEMPGPSHVSVRPGSLSHFLSVLGGSAHPMVAA